MNTPFTEEEKRVWDAITALHNAYVELPKEDHPMAMQEWCAGIHQLQSIMEHRAFRRLFPKEFR